MVANAVSRTRQKRTRPSRVLSICERCGRATATATLGRLLLAQRLEPLLLLAALPAGSLADLAVVAPQVDRRRAEQGQQLRHQEAADDRDAERLAHLRADAEADRQ